MITVGRLIPCGFSVAVLLSIDPTVRLSAQVDRTKPPTLGATPALNLPPARQATLANGLQLVVVEMHEVPLVELTVLVDAGSVHDPAELPGLATFTANMLDEGAGPRGALEIAEEVAYLGAQLNTAAGFDVATVTLHVPKRRLEPALDLLADVLLRPTFADSEVTRQRDLRVAALLQLRDQPVQMAGVAFPAIVFGSTHPYGRPLNGTDSSTALLSRARVRRFYDTVYRPNGAQVLVVGDVTLAEIRRLIDQRFGSWARGDVPVVAQTKAPAPPVRTIYLVDKPGAPQSVIRIGHPGVARATPDYFALEVLNTILGGSFTSRLNQNLRETHGYTYGAGSSFAMRRMAGPFTASASVVTDKTDSSLIEFLKELRRIRDEAVPAAELEKAKSYIVLGLPGNFETTGGSAAQYRDLLIYGLPLDYYASYMAGITAVTAADVQRVAQRHVDPDHFAIVVVGDRSQIESGIQALKEGPIARRDLWGNPLP